MPVSMEGGFALPGALEFLHQHWACTPPSLLPPKLPPTQVDMLRLDPGTGDMAEMLQRSGQEPCETCTESQEPTLMASALSKGILLVASTFPTAGHSSCSRMGTVCGCTFIGFQSCWGRAHLFSTMTGEGNSMGVSLFQAAQQGDL